MAVQSALSARRGSFRVMLATTLIVGVSGGAHAARIDFEIGASVLHSDNIGLDSSNAVSDTVLSPQLRFKIEQAGSAWRINARGDLQYLDYRDNTFDDQFRGAFSGQARWTMLPERLEFTFEDYLSRQPVDTLAAFNPNNEQQTNVFVTGPSLFARFGERTRGQLDLRYTNSYAEENKAFDSDRYNGALRLVRELTPSKRLSGNLEATRVNFDLDTPNSDYKRYDGYINYASRLRAGNIGFDVGYTRLELEDGRGSASSPLARGNIDWRVSPRSTLSADLSYQFSDAAQDLALNDVGPDTPIIGDTGNPQIPVAPQVFRERRLELGYQFAGQRLNVQVRPYYQRIHYVDTLTSDQSDRGGLFQLDYKLRARWVLSFRAVREDRDYDDLSRTDR
ncbi:MAG: hypothetical protein ABJA62_07165, partial [Luteimonas sp.]